MRSPRDDSHTYIHVDMSRCINCYACVRICADVQGQFVWHVVGRGEESQIVPDSFGAFGDSTCVSCGACSDACPTGALEDKTVIERGFPTEWTRTTCPYCGTGCEMNVGTRDDRVVQVKPVMDAPVNYGHLCVKGRYAFDFVDADDRVTEPMIRENGEWRVVSWEEAIRYAADKLKDRSTRMAKRASPFSARHGRRTKKIISLRNSPASCSARTMSIAVPVSATRRRRRR